jgi:hypothetical protein
MQEEEVRGQVWQGPVVPYACIVLQAGPAGACALAAK